jgi:hypothetical protein
MSTIEIRLPLPDDKKLGDCNNNEINAAMNPEVDAFSRWMRDTNQEGLVPLERTLIKTYIAWKLLHEKASSTTND